MVCSFLKIETFDQVNKFLKKRNNFKLYNFKLNKNICRNSLDDYKKQCDNTSLIYVEDCQKEQLTRARIEREKINNQIELLEQKQV